MKHHWLTCMLGIFAALLLWSPLCAATGGEGNAEKAEAPEGKNQNVIGNLKGIVVSATLKQAIGNFNSYGPIAIGDSFEVDLGAFPMKGIEFTPAKADKKLRHYVPLRAPLQIERAYRWYGGKSVLIEISEGADTGALGKCRISISAESLEKGSKVRVIIFVGGGFIGSMAEAEGVLK